MLLQYIFEEQSPDYKVTTAVDGPTALRHLQQQSFDLVLTDWHLDGKSGGNGMDGIELAENIQTISPDTRMLLMTGSGVLAWEGKTKTLFSGLIEKPFTIAELVSKIEQAVGS